MHEADVLAVGLLGDGEAEFARERRASRPWAARRGKAQQVELLRRRRIEEIALVPVRIGRAVERRAARPAGRGLPHNGRSPAHVGAELPRGLQKVAELDGAVALDAGDRRLAVEIALGEAVDHRLAEARLVVEHVMRDADRLGDAAGIVDVLAGAAGALAMGGGAVIVELQRDADDIVALALEQGRDDGRIDAARHGTTTRVFEGSVGRSSVLSMVRPEAPFKAAHRRV